MEHEVPDEDETRHMKKQLLILGMIFLPTLAWNAGHGWASFSKQGGRNLAWDFPEAPRHLGELFGSQIGLATPLIFLLSLGLGYIYERTGILWASITVHLLFNSTETLQYYLIAVRGH